MGGNFLFTKSNQTLTWWKGVRKSQTSWKVQDRKILRSCTLSFCTTFFIRKIQGRIFESL